MSSASKPIGMQLWRLVKEFRLQSNSSSSSSSSSYFIYQKYNSKLSNTAKLSPYSRARQWGNTAVKTTYCNSR